MAQAQPNNKLAEAKTYLASLLIAEEQEEREFPMPPLENNNINNNMAILVPGGLSDAQSPLARRAHYITAEEEGQNQEQEPPMPPLESSSGDEREDDGDAAETPRPIMARVRVMTDQQSRALETLRFLAGPRRPWLQEELLEEDVLFRDARLVLKKISEC